MRRLAGWCSGVAALALTGSAAAHQVGLSQGTYRVVGARVEVTLSFARAELRELAPELDVDRDRELSELELLNAEALLDARVIQATRVALDGDACAGSLRNAALTELDGLDLRATYVCEGPGRWLGVDFGPAAALGRHRHVARLFVAGEPSARAERVLHRARPRAELDLQAAPAAPAAPVIAPPSLSAPPPPSAPPPAAPAPPALDLLALGVEHILAGLDHLVFLLGLVVMGGSGRALLAVITAFTLGHSLSLALGALAVWAPSPALVEPLIALSVAYVGLENLRGPAPRQRWRIALPFGFVHGFGFAGALIEIGLPTEGIAARLLLFNLGVELGQLAALAVTLPALAALGRVRALAGRAWRRWISAAIALAGLAWFVERIAALFG